VPRRVRPPARMLLGLTSPTIDPDPPMTASVELTASVVLPLTNLLRVLATVDMVWGGICSVRCAPDWTYYFRGGWRGFRCISKKRQWGVSDSAICSWRYGRQKVLMTLIVCHRRHHYDSKVLKNCWKVKWPMTGHYFWSEQLPWNFEPFKLNV